MSKDFLNFLKNQMSAAFMSTCWIALIFCLALLMYPNFQSDGFYKYELVILFLCLFPFYCENPDVYKIYGVSFVPGEFAISLILLFVMGVFLIFVDDGGSKFYLTGIYHLDFLALCLGLHVFFRFVAILSSRTSGAE